MRSEARDLELLAFAKPRLWVLHSAVVEANRSRIFDPDPTANRLPRMAWLVSKRVVQYEFGVMKNVIVVYENKSSQAGGFDFFGAGGVTNHLNRDLSNQPDRS